MRTAVLFLIAVSLPSPAPAQCPTWRPELAGALEPDGEICALLVHDDDGAGPLAPALYVAGAFTHIAGVAADCVARFDGTSWSPIGALGAGLGTRVSHLAFFDADGPGPQPEELYASGAFLHVTGATLLRFDGAQWVPVPIMDENAALTVFDADGAGAQLPRLVATGRLANIWDGSTAIAVASFMPTFSAAHVNAACVFDADGPGPLPASLVVTGYFTGIGTPAGTLLVQAQALASFDGTTWSPFGGGLSFPAPFVLPEGQSLATRPLPSGGEELIVGGWFSGPIGFAAPGIAAWANGTWSAFGSGIDLTIDRGVFALQVFDVDGPGPASADLYAAGEFIDAGNQSTLNIARWDGAAWSAVEAGLGGIGAHVNALAVFDVDDSGPDLPGLFAGGSFQSANGLPAGGFARYTDHGCNQVFCLGDGSLATPCPCANFGSGGGCGNSEQPSGARLSFYGSTIGDTLQLSVDRMPTTSTCVFVQSSGSTPAGVVLGDGVSCMSGTLRRLASKVGFFGGAAYPEGDPSIATRSAALGDPLSFGDVRYYQVVYRDNAPGFCNPGTAYNVSSGLRIVW